MISTRNTLESKLITLAWCLLGTLSLITLRLGQLQIIQKKHLCSQSKQNCMRIESIAPLRGNILDRNGELLATNRPATHIYWQGTGNPRLSAEQLELLEKVQTITGRVILDDELMMQSIKNAEKRYKKTCISQDIPFEQLSQLSEQFPDQKNISLTTHFKRCYPYNTFACHVLGYLGRMDMTVFGKMGLEKLFEDTLKGEHGEQLNTINSLGRHLAQRELKKALAGKDITTTIDIQMQQMVELIVPEDVVGTCIIMDPSDGSLLALVSRPHFDPTMFLSSLEQDEWIALQNKKPFLNRAFNACYPPGSIFKLVTLSAALEHNLIKPDSHCFCPGYVEFAQRRYWCNNKHGHGNLSTEQALAHSCNIPFYEIGKKISIDTLADYAHRFGLGEKTNIGFTEKEGLIPTSAWKKRVKGERWWPGETLSTAIGQSYLLVTPIQIACMISSVYSGFVVKPRMLLEDPIVKRSLGISYDSRSLLQRSMRMTVKRGTGRSIREVKDLEIYAKTSTAQTSSLEKRDMGTLYKEHGWFAGFFKYKNNPPLTIVMLIEHAGSASVATNYARQFFSQYTTLMDSKKVD